MEECAECLLIRQQYENAMQAYSAALTDVSQNAFDALEDDYERMRKTLVSRHNTVRRYHAAFIDRKQSCGCLDEEQFTRAPKRALVAHATSVERGPGGPRRTR